jgi:hypothetical protein
MIAEVSISKDDRAHQTPFCVVIIIEVTRLFFDVLCEARCAVPGSPLDWHSCHHIKAGHFQYFFGDWYGQPKIK